MRALTALPLGALLALSSGCHTFEHDWKKAAEATVPADSMLGRWEGTWRSEVNGHNDSLRCVITEKSAGIYSARFLAKYQKVFSFGYTVPLEATRTNGLSQFRGHANLGWFIGNYDYEGHADGTNYFSKYHCSYDHGTFKMSRPSGTNAVSVTSDPLAGATQLVVVRTPDWSSVPGTLRRYERRDASAEWKPVGPEIPIVVGRNGLAWGLGLARFDSTNGNLKCEGDGKSPAGIFRLSSAFGLAPKDQATDIKLPYQELNSLIECVDDVKSTNYNSIIERGAGGAPDWNSSEKLRAVGAQYRLGVVVDHNVDPRVAGSGSCIFLHIWKDSKTGTSGCTAMADENIEGLVAWLDPAAHPLLVQLPQTEFNRLKKPWRLPDP